jgi:hypothetical protein
MRRKRSNPERLTQTGESDINCHLTDYDLWHLDFSRIRRINVLATTPLDLRRSKGEDMVVSAAVSHKAVTHEKISPQGMRQNARLHFALRAAHCAVASFRPLTPSELFAAATTQVFAEDPPWPTNICAPRSDVQGLIRLCSRFLKIGEAGTVCVRRKATLRFSKSQGRDASRYAHRIMTLICLAQIQRTRQRLILCPWLDYHDLRQSTKQFPLHEYVVTMWQCHYWLAEPYWGDLPGRLHHAIEAAWSVERRISPSWHGAGDSATMGIYHEALEVGLILSQSYGFKILQSAYVRMGISSGQVSLWLGKSMILASLAFKPILQDLETLQPTEPNETSDCEAFDFSDWTVIDHILP